MPLGEYPALAAKGKLPEGTLNFGGPIVTASGLVFCSRTLDNKIRAFDKTDGKQLWEGELPWDGSSPPTTYQIEGRQYIVIPATGAWHLDTKRGDAWGPLSCPQDLEPARLLRPVPS